MKKLSLLIALASIAIGVSATARAPKSLKVKPIGVEVEVRDFAAAYSRQFVGQVSALSYINDAVTFAETGKYEYRAIPWDPDDPQYDLFRYNPPYMLDMGSSDIDGHEYACFRGWKKNNGHTLFGVKESFGNDCFARIAFYDYDPATQTFTLDETLTQSVAHSFGHNFGNDENYKPVTCMHRIEIDVDGLHLYDEEDFTNSGEAILMPWDGIGFIIRETDQ